MHRNSYVQRHRNRIIAASAAGLFALAAGSGIASAKSNETRVTGVCSGTASAKLKVEAKAKDGRAKAEFEVEHATAGSTWHVVVNDNGVAAVTKDATAVAPENEIEVKAALVGATGHVIDATATDTVSGETCTASVTV